MMMSNRVGDADIYNDIENDTHNVGGGVTAHNDYQQGESLTVSEHSGESASSNSFVWSESGSTSWKRHLNLLQKLSFFVMSAHLPAAFIWVVVILELVQVVTLPLRLILLLAGGESTSVWECISYVRAPYLRDYDIHQYVVWGLLGFLAAVVLLFTFAYLLMKKTNNVPNLKLCQVLRYTLQILSALMLPMLYFFISIICCNSGFTHYSSSKCWEGNNVFIFAFSVVGLIFVISLGGYMSLFHVSVLPLSSWFSQSHTRISFLLFTFKVLMSLMEGVLSVRYARVYAVVTCIASVLLFVLHVVFLPFYKKLPNYLYGFCYSLCSWGSIAMITATATGGKNVSPILFAAGIPFLLFGSFLVTQLRLHKFSKIIKSYSLSKHYALKYPYQIDLLVHRVYQKSSVETELVETAHILFQEAIASSLQNSAYLHASYAVFLLEIKNDPNTASIHAKNAKMMDSAFDLSYKTATVLQVASDRIHEGERYHNAAKGFASLFWQLITRAQSDSAPNTNALLYSARQLRYYQERVESEFSDLLHNYPHSYKVARRYGWFQKVLKNDKEAAEEAFTLADELEDQATRRHRRRVDLKASRTSETGSKAVKFADQAANSSSKFASKGAPPEREETNSISSTSLSDSESTNTASSSGSAVSHLRSVRRRIESSKLSALKRLHLSNVFTITVLYLSILVAYLLTRSTFSAFKQRLIEMNSTVTCKDYTQSSVYYSRAIETALISHDDETASNLCYEMSAKLAAFEDSFAAMFEQSKISSEISNYWAESRVMINTYIPRNQSDYYTGFHIYTTEQLWDAVFTFTNSLKRLCEGMVMDGLPNLRGNPSFRFVMDNGPVSLIAALRDLGSLYSVSAAQQGTKIQISLYIIYSATLLISVVMVASVFLPTLRAIYKERTSLIRLFLDLPKSSVLNTTEKIGCDEKDLSHGNSYDKFSSLQKLSFGYFSSLALLLMMTTLIFTFVIPIANDYKNAGYEVEAAGTRVNLCTQLTLWSQELIVNDETSYTRNQSKVYWDSFYERFELLDRALKYGNDSLHVKSRMKTETDLFDLWYHRECPSTLGLNDCHGAATLLRYYADLIYLVANGSPSRLIFSNNHYIRATSILPHLQSWLSEDTYKTCEVALRNLNRTLEKVSLVFYLSLPMCLLLLLVVRFLIETMGIEIEQVFKMMLFIPVNVIDTVPSVNEYIETGHNVSEAAEQSYRDQEKQNKSILDACDYAVIVCNQVKTIEFLNPAAEKMTGFSNDQVRLQSIHLIIPDEIESNRALLEEVFEVKTAMEGSTLLRSEVTVQKKSGYKFSSLLSVSHSSLGGRKIHALFLRDITKLKEHEKELQKQQNRVESLLLNILPKSIADQLRQNPSHEHEKKRTALIAQQFESVTVLFADIVGFTSLSSSLSPEQLVMLLNSVFSIWDKLTVQFGVEKIKTIGDCYMVVSGAPIPFESHAEVMMDFAIAMLESLAAYNATSQYPINIRVGMNTGKVVAGVIGFRKIAYDLWGDTVNVASRMEHNGFPGCIQVTEFTYEKLKDLYAFERREKVIIAGKGEMTTYLWKPEATSPLTDPTTKREIHRGPTAVLDDDDVVQTTTTTTNSSVLKL
ncbi:PAS domain S-box protein [Pelomyxa schiedti]|nr:PAS domain S-box protein [Pelomyxa schiedti]